MATGYQSLTEKEKQTLRLIVRGHDAKSTARHLGLSVHTINERLREARRKLEVSSSREAARLVLNTEVGDPENHADKKMGEAAECQVVKSPDMPSQGKADATGAASGTAWLIAGVAFMSVILGIFALTAASQSTGAALSAAEPAAVSAIEAEVERSARDWLVMGDEGRFRDGWNATGKSFRELNSLERWIEVSQKVRVPLGAMISRTLISQESVPSPPAGVQVIKFRTSFANRSNAVETVSLAREDGAWKVVGIYID